MRRDLPSGKQKSYFGIPWDLVPSRSLVSVHAVALLSLMPLGTPNGRLPVPGVLRLLDVLRTTKQVMPTDEEVLEWDMSGRDPCHMTAEWRRILRRRKERLECLLRTAAELEEEVECDLGS
jgi:hypothetical protein